MPAWTTVRPRAWVLILVLAAALLGIGAPARAAVEAGQAARIEVPQWAPAASATIHPGVSMTSESGQCTANFVFYEPTGGGTFEIYLGFSAHCAAFDDAVNGCTGRPSRPLGTPVTIQGADHPGSLAYSARMVMQANGEPDESVCRNNDFALVRVDPRDHGKVNPSIPVYGGPRGVNTDGTELGTNVYSYGNSGLRFGLAPTSPREGYSIGTSPNGWSHTVYMVTPGIPGDSGSAVLDAQGRALGSLSTGTLAPFAGANGISDIKRVMDYANANSPLEVALADGTEPFVGGQLP